MRWILLAILMPCMALGQSITGVFGFVGSDSTMTIVGSNFGDSGPNLFLFDNFEDGVDGQSTDLNATVGSWTLRRTVWDPQYVADDDGSGMAFRAVYGGVVRIMEMDFGQDVTEVYITYRIKIPDGKYYPWAFADETMSNGSNWKLTWLLDGVTYGGYDDDFCTPTWMGMFVVDGNSTPFVDVTADNDVRTHHLASGTGYWFVFDDWNRYSIWLQGGNDPDVDNGICWQQCMSETYGQVTRNKTDEPIFNPNRSSNGSHWSYLIFPGWTRGGQGASPGDPETWPDPNAEAWYDDIYVAIGNNAQARIEIGDNSIYEDCTLLEICTPTNWGSGEIEATVQLSQFESDEPAYVFVIDSTGNASEGYPVLIGQHADQGMGPPVNPEIGDGD